MASERLERAPIALRVVGVEQNGVVVGGRGEDLFVWVEEDGLDVLGVFHQNREAFKVGIWLDYHCTLKNVK